MAEEAVRWNGLSRRILGFGKDEDLKFREEYKIHCGQNHNQASCQNILSKWKNISYKNNAGLSNAQIIDWENRIDGIYNNHASQCGTDDANCQRVLRTARDYYAISYGGDEMFLQQMEIIMHTYLHGSWDAIKNKGIPYIVAGMAGVADLGRLGVQGQGEK